MLRAVLLAAAVALPAAARAADPDLTGNWLITYSTRPGFETNYAVVKIETKDGKPAATVLDSPLLKTMLTADGITVAGKTVTIGLSAGPSFEGVLGDDPKVVRGNFGDDRAIFRARMTRTEKDKVGLTAARGDVPPPMAELPRLQAAVASARLALAREKDADNKKELQAKVDAAQKEYEEQATAAYRETLAKHADSPAAIDAALGLLTGAAKAKTPAAEVATLAATLEKLAAPYGPRYVRTARLQAAAALTSQPGTAAVAADLTGKLAQALTDADPPATQVRVLAAHKAALRAKVKAGAAAAKAEFEATSARLETWEQKLDATYLAKNPPLKTEPFAGRKDPKANRVAVVELFTGAECPPCVAADVAFDSLNKAYKPTDLVLLQYHLHIPGPDPLTNRDTVARWEYYRKAFPDAVRGTPTTAFSGKPATGGGGARAAAEKKYGQYVEQIGTLLDQSTPVKVTGTATRSGDKLSINAKVDGAAGDDLRLRLVVVEEEVRFSGGNGLRFHHHVVRAMPGGADGVAVKGAAFEHAAAVDLEAVRADTEKYLDEYAATRAFPRAGRPLDYKHLKVIALVQNDATKEVVQAVQLDVGGK
jgi:hypothetical protein